MDTGIEPKTIKLTDGIERTLRYTVASSRRLTKSLGASMIAGMTFQSRGNLTEENMVAVIFEGLCDPDTGKPPADVTKKDFDKLKVSQLVKMFKVALESYNEDNDSKNEESPDEIKAPAIEETTSELSD